MTTAFFVRENTIRPYTRGSFEDKLTQFYNFIEEFTYIDEELNPEERQQLLRSRFQNGYEPFLQLIRRLFGDDVHSQDIKAVFRKIATNPDAHVDWSELFGIDLNVAEEVQELEKPKEGKNVFELALKKVAGTSGGDRRSRENVQCITYSPELNLYITATLHGIVCHWNSKFRIKSSVEIGESYWVTGCCVLPYLRKVVITTERSIVLWDYRTKGKSVSTVHIKPLETSPQCVVRVPWKSNIGVEDYFLFGDDQGYVNLVTINTKDVGGVGKKSFEFNVVDPGKLSGEIMRRKFHTDAVVQVRYFPQLQMFGSCSASRDTSLVLARLDNVFDNRSVREMSLPKGVNCFDYCSRANVIVTGGIDKTVRIWHPLILSRPTGKLIGHLFTVVDIAVNERDQHVISMSTAKIFRVWDIQKLQCLQSFAVNETQVEESRSCTMMFDGKHDQLITGTHVIELWPLDRDQDSQVVPHTHERAITCILYNQQLNQIVSACTECQLRVWEMETGELVHHLKDVNGSGKSHVTAMCADTTGHKLITAGHDGSFKMWDFISAYLLKSFETSNVGMNQSPIKDVIYHVMSDKRFIIAATVNRGIRLLEDCQDSPYIEERFVLSDAINIQVEQIRLGNTPDAASERSLPTVSGIGRKESRLSGLFFHADVTSMDLSIDDNLLACGLSTGDILMWDIVKKEVVSRISYDQMVPSGVDNMNKSLKSISRVLFCVHTSPILRTEDYRSQVDSRTYSVISAYPPNIYGRRTNMSISTTGNHPAYSVDVEDSTIRDKFVSEQQQDDCTDDQMSREKRIVLLFVSYENGLVSLINTKGFTLLQTILPEVNQRSSYVTAVCKTPDDMQIFTGSSDGYIVCWNVSNFWKELEIITSKNGDIQLLTNPHRHLEKTVEQTAGWRAHLTRVTSIALVSNYNILVSSSTDASVRVWHCSNGHFLGFFGQSKPWHFNEILNAPPSPLRPHDIVETPLRPLKRIRITNPANPQPKTFAKCPLAFDNKRWKSQEHQTQQLLPTIQEKISPRDKKFFSSLTKPKHYNNHLESSTSSSLSDPSAVFRSLPVYQVDNPEKVKTPAVNLREPTWFSNLMKPAHPKRKRCIETSRKMSSYKDDGSVTRFPHLVSGKRR